MEETAVSRVEEATHLQTYLMMRRNTKQFVCKSTLAASSSTSGYYGGGLVRACVDVVGADKSRLHI